MILFIQSAWPCKPHWQNCPVGWGCRIHQRHLRRGLRPLPNEWPEYDTKQSDSEALVMLELWGMRSTLSLPSLPGLLGPGVVAPNRALSMGQMELNCALMLNWISWKRNILTFKIAYSWKAELIEIERFLILELY